MARWWGALGLVGMLAGTSWGQEAKPEEEGGVKTEPAAKAPEPDSSLVSGLGFRNIGPALMSGRVVDLAIDPVIPSTWYLAAGSGGVWKTTNAGTTWDPIFDGYGSYSIGCLAIDPNNRHVVWVGTGENNSQRSVGYGDGVYRSLDGGKSFERVGLEKSEHIGMIRIDPRDSNVVYVAAQGPLWAPGGDRGLYKTTNGGKTWSKILEISENTGVSEVHLDPRNPDVLYAVAYQRRRHQWTLINGGPESGLYKSTDAGASWRRINRGLPGGDKGRIGLAVSPANPDVLYAIVEAAPDEASGVFRSEDTGETWSRMGGYLSSSPQYYQELFADPSNVDRVYSMDTLLHVSEDGGRTFRPLGESDKHVDNHALWIDPYDTEHLLIGCDGGLYETFDRGRNYKYFANLPLTQFYKIAVDEALPFYNVYGGTQDNATQGGPSRTSNVNGIRNSDWFVTVFGDGFDPAVDPTNPDIVYSQWQYGGLVRFDRKTGERVDIKPQEEREGPPLRWNWDSALLLSPHSPTRVYYGAQILFQSDDRGDTWRAISPDLTRNLDRNQLEVMGRVWSVDAVAKNDSTSFFGTIVALTESPLVPGLIYVGTDDGLIQITEDGGQSWRKVEKFDFIAIPEMSYISDLEASRHDPNTVYAAIHNFKRGDFKPYVVKSVDRGKSWTLISSDLPERGSVYTLALDHVKPEMLFAGTEFGVFVTLDGGKKWLRMGGLPTIAVRELEIQRRESDLVVGTFGRGIAIVDDYSPLRELSGEVLSKDAHIFPIKKAQVYIPADPLGGDGKAFQGADFFVAPNPPFGATFTYYLKEGLDTRLSKRRQKEAELARQGRGTPYPSWDDLKAEDREEEPVVLLTIRDATNAIVRRIAGSTSSGLHRASWDIRFTGTRPVGSARAREGFGPLALPGNYTVSLSKRVDGEETELVPPTPFVVEPLLAGTIPVTDPMAVAAFHKQTAELQRAALGALEGAEQGLAQVGAMKRAIELTPGLASDVRKEARDLEIRLLDLLERFTGDPTRPRRNEPAMPGLIARLDQVVSGTWVTTSAPTLTQRRNFEIAADEFTAVLNDLRTVLEKDLPELGRRLEEAGAPWTPGRPLPSYKKP